MRGLPRLTFSAPELPRPVWYQAEISLKYEGYIKRQLKQVEDFAGMENKLLPDDINYDEVTGLRLEAREKLKRSVRTPSVRQAASPAYPLPIFRC